MNTYFLYPFAASVIFSALFVGAGNYYMQNNEASVALSTPLPFKEDFSKTITVNEGGVASESAHPYWWVNSGGYLTSINGIGSTVLGELPVTSPWRSLYASENPIDTDNGYHPQNIFRLVSRASYQDVAQSVYYKIDKINLSNSPNRNASNGILLFSRYQNGNNLYYLGLRVDGTVVIKKKKSGLYYTMAQKELFPGVWNTSLKPNLIPLKTWIGLKSVTKTEGKKVSLKLYTDIGKTGTWTEVLSVVDDGVHYGGKAFVGKGFGGIRTDFMDVSFSDYLVDGIPQ